MTIETGYGRRAEDAPRTIGELIDEPTIESIAQDAWTALVGEDEVLVPIPADLPTEVVSSWVDVVGPWNGSVVLTTGRQTAEELTRLLLRDQAPEVLEDEDVADALGELANVVGGNVKAALPGPSKLGLPEVGEPPSAGDPADVCRVDVLWRGQPLTLSVQGAAPSAPSTTPHTTFSPNGASQ